MSDAAGGQIRIPEDTFQGYRMADGYTVLPKSTIDHYGIDLIKYLFPDSVIVAFDLIESDEEDGQVRPETPGGQI
jgi:hypothetical protein